MFSFSDSNSDEESETSAHMPSAWAEKLDKLEKLHDEMERDQDSQRERGKNYMQISSETEGPEMPPTEKGDRSPAVMKHDSHNTPEIDESCSPTSSVALLIIHLMIDSDDVLRRTFRSSRDK